MPHTRLWVHAAWSTKHRAPLLTRDLRSLVITHIISNAKLKHVIIDSLNGVDDHLHVLLMLRPHQSLARIMQLVKGESSHWINDNEMLPIRFRWQEEYFAVSISEWQVGKVRKYILNQERHHRRQTPGKRKVRIPDAEMAREGLTMDFD